MAALWLLHGLLLPAAAGAHPTGFAPGWNGKAAKPPMGALPAPLVGRWPLALLTAAG